MSDENAAPALAAPTKSYFESFGILYLTCDVYILHKWCGSMSHPLPFNALSLSLSLCVCVSMHHFKCKWCDQDRKSFCLHRNDAARHSKLMIFGPERWRKRKKAHTNPNKSCQTELLIFRISNDCALDPD